MADSGTNGDRPVKNLQQIREEIAALHDESEAILALTKSENREPDADESKRLDEILASNESLKAQEARAVKLESLKAEAIARRNPQAKPTVENDGSVKTRIEVPSSVSRPANISLGRGVMNRIEQESHAYAFGRVALAGLFNHEPSREWCRSRGYELRNAMTEGFDSKGGVLVPEEFEASLIRLVNDYGVAARELQAVPMASDTKIVPRRTGGSTAYYVAEAGTITASDPAYDKVQLTAKKLAVLNRYSSEVNEDSAIAIGAQLADEAALAIANAQDSAAFLGDGTSTYGRIVGLKTALQDGSEVTAATGNTAFATLDLDDFEALMAKLPSYAYRAGNVKWYIHRTGWAASMLRLAAAAGGNTVQNIVNGVPQQTFLGYPVVFVEVMNSTTSAQTSTEGLCYFGDLRMAGMIGQRRGIAMAMSDSVYFTTDELAVRWTTRYDINIHDVGTASVAGAIVGLETPGS